MSKDFDAEVTYIIDIFRKADYLLRFMNNIVKGFVKPTNDLEDSYIVPPNLFNEQKPFILIEITFCDRNENKPKGFIRKFHEFTNNKPKISINGLRKKS